MSNAMRIQILPEILGYLERSEAVPLDTAEGLIAAATRESGVAEASVPSLLKSLALIRERRFLDALIFTQEVLSKDPHSLELQTQSDSIFEYLLLEVEKVLKVSSLPPDFGEIYTQLIHLGIVPIRFHRHAINYFLRLGDAPKAVALAGHLRKVAPNLQGLLSFRVPAKSDVPKVGIRLVTSTPHLNSEMMAAFSTIRKLDAENNSKAVLERSREMLQSHALSEQNRSYLRYYEAVALDQLGQSLDALEILLELVEQHAAHFKYAHSLLVTIEAVKRQAVSLAEKDPLSKALVNYAVILERIDFCPFLVQAALSLQDARGGNPGLAKARMEAMLALSPNDLDYLKAAIKVATAIGDRVWLASILDCIANHVEERPYLIKHQFLLDEYRVTQSLKRGPL